MIITLTEMIKTLIINIASEKVFLKSTQKIFDEEIPYECLSEGKQILNSIGRDLEPQSELMTLVDCSQAYQSMGIQTTEARRKAMSPKYKELFKQFQILYRQTNPATID